MNTSIGNAASTNQKVKNMNMYWEEFEEM
jgi:hypothetical protein